MKDIYKHLADEAKTDEESLARLKEIITILRKECPWDRVQTHQTLTTGMIEEAYEVVEAINNGDMDNLEEELGDVMLQVVFHANLAEESETFELKSLINRECDKMIRRHPHVFLEEKVNNHTKTIDNVLEKWENIKASEKAGQSQTAILSQVPLALPALTRAAKVQKKAAEVGFDWDHVSYAMDKVKEETTELIEAYNDNLDENRIREELGDLLFSVVNVARFLKINPEEALKFTTDKFIRRFNYVEEQGLACGKSMEEMTLEEMDKLWDKAKELEK